MRPVRGRSAVRSRRRRGRAATGRRRPEQARGGEEGAGLAGVPPAVPRPDAARAARRRDRQHRRAAGVVDRSRDHRPDRAERGPGAQPGGKGRGERGRAPEDAPDPRACPPRRGAGGHPCRGARAGRHHHVRGGRQGPRRRAPDRGRDAGDRGGGAHRREHPGAEVGRAGCRRGHPARRPSRHGLHELDGDPWAGRDGGHGDGNGDRGRADLGDAGRGSAGEDAACAPARPADRPDHDHGRGRASARDRLRADPRRRLRRPVRDRYRPRDRCHPDRPAGGCDDHALARDAGARGEGSDREAAPIRGDARLDLGDLLRQDRHADAQPDDRPRARRRRAPVLDRGRGLLHRGQDPPHRGRDGDLARPVPPPDGPRQRRGGA